MEEIIELNATVNHKRYYDPNSMWGVYAFYPNTNVDKVTLDKDGYLIVNGTTPELSDHKEYDIEIIPTHHPKYGDQYSFVAVKAERPTTVREQQEYIELMVTPKQYKEIIKVYPNSLILDLMENDEFDYTNMNGIKEATYQRIKRNLFENMEIQEALVELKDLQITFDAMKRLIDHFGSAQVVVQRVKNNIYDLCQVKMFGFVKVDSYYLNNKGDPTGQDRIIAAVDYILKQDAESGHSWVSRRELIKRLLKLLEIEEGYIEDVLQHLKKEGRDIYFEGDKVALQKNYFYESEIKKKLFAMLEQPCTSKHVVIGDKITEQEKELGFSYTEEQKEAIQMAIDNNVLIINGKGGVGKSSIVKGVLDALEGYSYMGCALSGKAAKVLSDQGVQAKTIHRMLGFDPETGGFIHNKDNLLPHDIVVLDEASMANNYLIYSVVTALKDGAKFIMVGDNGQLPSIGTGAVFDDLLTSNNQIPKRELTTVHRQAQKSGILSAANEIREGKQINDKYSHDTKVYGELRDMVLIPVDGDTDIMNMVLDICRKNDKRDLNDFQVLTGRVDSGDISVKNLNIEMQKIFNDVNKPFVNRGGYEYREGDKIIQNGNNYEAPIEIDFFNFEHIDEEEESETVEVFNGTIGKIERIEFDSNKSKQDHKIYIKFEDIKDLVVYSVTDLQQIDLAYAISTHKSQGSTIKHVLFAFDFASYMLLSKEFVYTGITRASGGCIVIAENDALHFAINKTAGGSRRTFLKEMLMEDV